VIRGASRVVWHARQVNLDVCEVGEPSEERAERVALERIAFAAQVMVTMDVDQ
jgi:hypothetical protein